MNNKYIKKNGLMKEECLRIFGDWKFYVSILLYILMCFYIVWGKKNQAANSLYDHVTGISNYNYLLVLIASLPTACTFCDDYLGNYIRPAVSRTGVKLYITGKIISSYITSFLIAYIGMNIFCFIEFLRVGIDKGLIYKYGLYGNLINSKLPFLYFIAITFIYALTSSVFSLYGIALSAVLPNRFVAVMAPLFTNICIEEISYSLPKGFRIRNLFDGGRFSYYSTGWNMLFSMMVICCYCIIACVIFSWIVKRRIRNEII